MILKGIVDEDFANYKVPSMFIAFPKCSFKCEMENKDCCCQNSVLAREKNIEVGVDTVARRYIHNEITRAIVCGGLDPMDSFDDLHGLINYIRRAGVDDDIVIYTGYTEDEVRNEVEVLRQYKNIVIKFGRFIPNGTKRYDEVLGVTLASDNQYAKRIS